MKLLSWILSLIMATGLFLLVRPVIAQTIDFPRNVVAGATSNEEGFSQIYYEYNGSRKYITDTRYTNTNPVAAGNYITWVGEINGLWQIFVYDLVGETTTQLTFTGNNVNPKIDDKGRIVLEGWDGETWQIFFFDGVTIKQLTIGDTSLNPGISEEYISYGRRNIAGVWRAVVYSINDNKSIDVTIGENARKPEIVDGDIYLRMGDTEEKFPLKVSELFLLNLTSLSEGSNDLELVNPVLDELSSTPSGVMEIPIATQSASE
jgi:hypothetical protein